MNHDSDFQDAAARRDAFEREFALRLTGLAEQALSQGLPPDLTVRAMLSAALAFAQRFDSGASIAQQLQPVLDHLADEPRLSGPLVQ